MKSRSASPPKNRGASPPRSFSTINRLQITVLEAKGLTPKDKHMTELGGKALQNVANAMQSEDPYCKVSLGKQSQKTSSKTNTLSPKWNETMIFDNFDPNTDDIKVTIRDSFALQSALFKGHLFGEVSIPVKLLQKGQDLEQWYPLIRKKTSTEVSGFVLLKIKLEIKEENLGESTEQPTSEKTLEKSPSERFIEKVNESPKSESSMSNSAEQIPAIEEPIAPPELVSSDSIVQAAVSKSSTFPEQKPRSQSVSKKTPHSSGEYSYGTSSRRSSIAIKNNGAIEYRDPITAVMNDEFSEKNNHFISKFGLSPDDTLVKDFSCALQRNILLHGRMYVSQSHVCFYSNLFGVKTQEVIPIKDITDINKIKNISKGIQIKIIGEQKINFVSFFSRDKAFHVLIKLWKQSKSGIHIGDSQPTIDEPKDSAENNEAEEESENPEEEEEEGEDSFLTNAEGDGGFLNTESSELKQVVSEELPVSLMRFFKLFFASPSFSNFYHEKRGDVEVSTKEWENHPPVGTTRQIHYRAPLNYAIGPSSARVEETQRYHLTKTKLVVETVTHTFEIPYADTFRVEGKWEVVPVTANTCHLTINIGVHFMKKTLFRGKIESSSIKENKDSFNLWISLAKREIVSQGNNTLTKNSSSSNIQSSKAEEERDNPSPIPVTTAPILSNSDQIRPARKFPFNILNITNYFSFDKVKEQPLQVLLVAGNFWMMIMLYLFGFIGFMLIILMTMNIYLGLRLVEVEQRVSSFEKKLINAK